LWNRSSYRPTPRRRLQKPRSERLLLLPPLLVLPLLLLLLLHRNDGGVRPLSLLAPAPSGRAGDPHGAGGGVSRPKRLRGVADAAPISLTA
jgi:hypothetical protein